MDQNGIGLVMRTINTKIPTLEELGMQTFDKALFDLYQANFISYEDALRFSDSHNDLRIRIKLEPGGRKPVDTGDKTDMHVV